VSSFTDDEDFDSELDVSDMGDSADADGGHADGYSSDELSGSDDEDMSDRSSEEEQDEEDSDEELNERQRARKKTKAATQSVDDLESSYETRRKLQASAQSKGKGKADDEDQGVQEVAHLPIKLANGEIQMVPGTTKIEIPQELRTSSPTPSLSDDDMSGTDLDDVDEEDHMEKLAKQKGRFGRMSVLDVVTYEDPNLRNVKGKGVAKMRTQQRLAIAKEQIAKTGAEIMAGGELIDNVGDASPAGNRHALT
jgi:nucleolar complex protein 3